MLRNIVTISFFSFFFVLASFNNTGPHSIRRNQVQKVVIDAGHGGHDPGTSGKYSREKNIALKIALELGDIIKERLPDVEVIYTRKSDKFIELDDRAEIANKNDADIFISIHCNASAVTKSVYGTETYVMGTHKTKSNLEVAKRENSVILLEEDYQERYEGFDPKSPESHILFELYQNAHVENSLKLAASIEHQFKNRAGRRSRGVKQAGFWVLWRTTMPSVLVETGYLTNPKEEKDLNDELKQSYIASAIFRAIRDYKEEMESSN
ncbi:MAG: N-acetylmuramoyl-L-alanine amidase [Cyclobacteriaceae bacterium]|nr:N-acetylmuramoyl-L-alanine amidase [Cyclobacteriaceae bacterium]